MKYSSISLLFAASVAAFPEPTVTIDEVIPGTAITFHEDVSYVAPRHFAKRDDPTVFHCQRVTPDTAMPTNDAALAIASYLEGLGQNTGCGMSRAYGDHSPIYQNLAVAGNTEINLFFTPGKDASMQNVISASYPCNYIGRYIRLLVSACSSNNKVQGDTEVPNCPNSGISWAVPAGGATPDQDGGASVEIMPIHTRHGKKRSITGETYIHEG